MSNFGHTQDLFDVKSVDRNATFKTFCDCEMHVGLGDVFCPHDYYISGQILCILVSTLCHMTLRFSLQKKQSTFLHPSTLSLTV